ncbi:hypothetical protein [Paenibacillus kribbensis]|uniref:hypothetical protein n=1 Tax=Paenibacillus kribbensis TaxID=172713 RepID=UPI0015BB4ECE|nr:hypothetical protein [Paenibacillus kribbensis]
MKWVLEITFFGVGSTSALDISIAHNLQIKPPMTRNVKQRSSNNGRIAALLAFYGF